MASRSHPLPREQESFSEDHATQDASLPEQRAEPTSLVFAQRRQPTEVSSYPYFESENSETPPETAKPERPPSRAIFSDLEEAGTRIRSGSVGEKTSPDSHHFGEDERPATQPVDLGTHGSPTLSKAARLSQSMSLELETTNIPDSPRRPNQSQEIDKGRSPIRRTLAALSSSFSGPSSSEAALNSQPIRDPLSPAKKSASARLSELFYGKGKSTPVLPTHAGETTGHWSRIRSRLPQPSLLEGSTIDNILRQYKNSDAESFASPNRATAAFDRNLSDLTDNSFFSGDHDVAEGSYASQHNTLPRSAAQNNLSSAETALSEQDANDLADITEIRSDYNPRRKRPSLRFASNHELSQSNQSRLPLEQAIMELRRVSNASFSSQDSNSTIRGQMENPALPCKSPNRGTQEDPSSLGHAPARAYVPQSSHCQQMSGSFSELIQIDDETRRLAQTALFYNEASMDPEWNAEDTNGLRVKSGHANPGTTSSPPEKDAEDWETVSSEGPRRECPSSRCGHGHGIYQTTNSIGDSSDAGTQSTYEEMSQFGSTDRIIQHPGNIGRGRQFRQLNVKHGKMPVMAPKFGDHRVNGYPADSMRTRPVQLYTTLSSLGEPHKNRFAARVPRAFTPKSRQPTGMPQGRENRNPFAPSSSSTASNGNELYPRALRLTPRMARADRFRYRQEENEVDYNSILSTQSSMATNSPRHLGNSRNQNDWDYQSSFAQPGQYQHRQGHVNTFNNQLPLNQADGFSEVDMYAVNHGDLEQQRHRPTQMRVPVSPEPFLTPRPTHIFDIEDPDHQAEEDPRHERISNICLWSIQIFPPFNVLFAAGAFDILMLLFTWGRIRKFSDNKKRTAHFITILWVALCIMGALVFGLSRLVPR
jgi:hypothetical protein